MVDESKRFNNLSNESIPKDDELDLKKIFKFFNRNKNFLAKFSLFFLILGFSYSFLPKRVWEGQFQIVLRLNDNKSSFNLSNPFIEKVAGSGSSNNLKSLFPSIQ